MNLKTRYRLAGAAFKTLILFVASPASPVFAQTESIKLKPNVSVRYINESSGIDSLGYVGGFLPFNQSGTADDYRLWFVEGGAKLEVEEGDAAGSVALGYRTLNQSNRIFGAYVGFDVRDTDLETFNQVTLGAESLGESFDIRANGFLALSDRAAFGDKASENFRFSENSLLFDNRQAFLAPVSGLDLEVGTKLADFSKGALRAYAGLYYWDVDGGDSTVGWRTRLVATPTPALELGLALQNDDIFGTKVSFSIGSSFPKSSQAGEEAEYNPMVDRLTDPLVKNANIILDTYEGVESGITATNPETGNPWFFSFVDTDGNSNGTFESPFSDLQTALDDAETGGVTSNDGIAYVLGGGTFDGTGITIPEGVSLLSDGPAQLLPVGNANLPGGSNLAFLPGSDTGVLPTIDNSEAIIFENDTTIDGFELNGGLFISDVGGITIADNEIRSFDEDNGGDGIRIFTSSDVDGGFTITGNTIEAANKGIYIYAAAYSDIGGDIVITENIIETRDGAGIYAGLLSNSSVGNITISGNTIDSNGTNAVKLKLTDSMAGDITVTDNNIDAEGDGVYLYIYNSSDVGNITVASNIIDATGDGVAFYVLGGSTTGDVEVADNDIDADDRGVYFDLDDADIGNISISGNTIDAGVEGIRIDAYDFSTIGNITIADNDIDGTYGIYIELDESDTGAITISGNTIDANDYDGILIDAETDSSTGDITITNNDIDAADYGIYITLDESDTGAITISGNTIDADEQGIRIDAESYSSTGDIAITDNDIDGTYGIYIELDESDTGAITISGNTIDANDYEGIRIDAESYSSTGNIAITNNSINADDEGIRIELSDKSNTGDITVADNDIDGGYGVYIDLNDSDTGAITISGNTIDANDYDGILIDAKTDSSTGDITITNNTIDAEQYGIYIALDNSDTGAITISGNTVIADTQGIRIYAGDTATSEDITITGNDVNSGGSGVTVDLHDADAGVITVSGNTIDADGDGVYIHLYQDVTIEEATVSDNIIDADEDGVDISVDNNSEIGISITGNTIDANDDGIDMNAYNGSSIEASVSNNVITSDDDGVDISAENNSDIDVDVTGNTVDADDNGVDISAENNSDIDVDVTGNTVDADEDGVYAEADNATITGSVTDNILNVGDQEVQEVEINGGNVTLTVSGNQ